MNNQFSQRVSDIITYSKEEANRLRNRYIGPEHLLLGMLRDGGGKAIEILLKLDIDLKRVKSRLEGFLKDAEDDTLLPDAEVPLSPMTAKILKMCMLEARLLKSATADTEHVLLAILKDGDNLAATVLEEHRVDYQAVFEQLSMKSTNPNAGMGFTEDDEEDEEDMNMSRSSRTGGAGSASAAQAASRKPSNDTPVLDNFGVDMTRAAEEGKLDPVVGREREIERLAQILSRRKKNNPVLIGEPGVGKSAIVEGLALRIVQKKVSRILFEKRVVMLDMASVVAGTKYRGQFEERIRSIINELQKNPNVILFIDEIHTIVGAGAAAGSMDAANMLKPALARGEIQCIGATTLDEYRKNIEKDGALERRFQKVIVEPTTAEETLQILKNIKEKYEDHHNVSYTDEALEACVKLSARYIIDRNFPDKAIDALDEAGSRVHLTNINVPKEIEEQEKLIEEARSLKAEAVKSQNFELAASYRDREKELSVRLEEMKVEWEARLKDDRQTVGEEEIANVISMMSGVPVQRMAQAEGLKLAGMKEELQAKVIAQDAAIEKLTKAILRSRVGLKDPNHPIGTFMFLGPTGVGKTHLAKQLAKREWRNTSSICLRPSANFSEKRLS
jgi:ATP-dependent Clp protease ATP-binding subunit ClpC